MGRVARAGRRAAIAGLPPLNGFVSEWLLLQAFLFTPTLPQSFVNMLVPVAAAALVLAAALAAYVMVKFYGVDLPRPAARGQPRATRTMPARSSASRSSGSPSAASLLGVFPVNVIALLDPVNALLLGAERATPIGVGNWLMLAPIGADRSSYSPLILLLVIVAVVLLTMQVVHRLYHGRVRRAPPWDCGFPLQTPRMQDTAEGFGQPIRQVFEPFFRIERAPALAVRREAALLGQGRGPVLALALSADRARSPIASRASSAGSSRAASRCT